jgi:hypothetical protein
MSFLKKNDKPSKNGCTIKSKLRYLSSKNMYGKDTLYFEILDPADFDVLEEFNDTHKLPMFKGDDDIIILKIYSKNVAVKQEFERNDVINADIRFKEWVVNENKGLSVYLNRIS